MKRFNAAYAAIQGRSRPARGAWIETRLRTLTLAVATSRPARGAWIETYTTHTFANAGAVAPRAGRVD